MLTPREVGEMEAMGECALAIESALLDSRIAASPFDSHDRDFPDADMGDIKPTVDRSVQWVRLSVEPEDRETVLLSLPDGTSYRLTQRETRGYLANMGHDKPDDFLGVALNFYDAIWFPQDGVWHRITEKDRRRWAWSF